MKNTIKKVILDNYIFREIYFSIFGKKINRKKIDIKIRKLSSNNGKPKTNYINGLIISLTTYGDRVKDIKYTLYSFIEQTILPEKILIWITDVDYISNKKHILEIIDIFQGYFVEFCITKDIKSYKKLIPALLSFPDCCIVTADDDIYYRKKWLEKLWNEHKKHPNEIIVHIAHKIRFYKNTDKNVKTYNQWDKNVKTLESSFYLFPTGCGGVLWQKRLLHDDIVSEELFMKLCPLADDIWFYFMSILAKTKVHIVSCPYNKLRYIDVYKEYGLNNRKTLSSENVEKNKNDDQFMALLRYYKLEGNIFNNYLNYLEKGL
jgi:hypothetical protein